MKDQDMRKFLNYNYLNSLTDQTKISNEKSLGQKKHLNKSKNTAYRIGQVNPHYNSSSPRKLAMKSNIYSFKEPSIFDDLILDKHNTQQFLNSDLLFSNKKDSSTQQFTKNLDANEYMQRNFKENFYIPHKFKDLITTKGKKINNSNINHNKSSRNNKLNYYTNQIPSILSQTENTKNSESLLNVKGNFQKSQITETFSKIQHPKLKINHKTNSLQINKTDNLKISDNLIIKNVFDSQNFRKDNKHFLTSNLANLKSTVSNNPFFINSLLDEKNLAEEVQIINKRIQNKKNIRPKNSKIHSFNSFNNSFNILFDMSSNSIFLN